MGWTESSLDYAGVSMTSRDANSKKAATEASKLFQDYYPELLAYVVDPHFLRNMILTNVTLQRQVLCQCSVSLSYNPSQTVC